MPLHFAAARSAAHSPIARALARKALARAANDNGDAAHMQAEASSFDHMMRAALRHFAEHGMGAAEAKLFAQEGAKVIIADVLEQEGRKIEAEITARPFMKAKTKSTKKPKASTSGFCEQVV